MDRLASIGSRENHGFPVSARNRKTLLRTPKTLIRPFLYTVHLYRCTVYREGLINYFEGPKHSLSVPRGNWGSIGLP